MLFGVLKVNSALLIYIMYFGRILFTEDVHGVLRAFMSVFDVQRVYICTKDVHYFLCV